MNLGQAYQHRTAILEAPSGLMESSEGGTASVSTSGY
jgi:hypothetical protein